MTEGSRSNREVTLLASQQHSPEGTADSFPMPPLDAKIIPLGSVLCKNGPAQKASEKGQTQGGSYHDVPAEEGTERGRHWGTTEGRLPA